MAPGKPTKLGGAAGTRVLGIKPTCFFVDVEPCLPISFQIRLYSEAFLYACSRSAASSMRLQIENLGGIKNADLNIAPLTILIGPNNANKTWAAYCLYALAAQLSPPHSSRLQKA